MSGSVQRPLFYGLGSIVLAGTAYSVLNSTYLDTSNPLLSHLPHPLSGEHYFASKSNILNVYFIKKAWGWTSAVFLLSWLTSPRQQLQGRGASRRLARYLTLTAIWIVFTGWFFGPAILERFVAASGGQCVLPGPGDTPVVVPNEYCFTKSTISADSHPELFVQSSTTAGGDENPLNPLQLIKGVPRLRMGHDVSGHIFLLTMSILLLADQLQASFKVDQKYWSTLHTVSVGVNTLLIAVWMWASAMTSVYFHSPLEKLTGFALGYAAYSLTDVLLSLIFGADTHTQSAAQAVPQNAKGKAQ